MNYNNSENVPPVWQVGDVILDRYEVKQVFTGGGMGLVYRVHHHDWAMDLAVKSPRSEFFQTRQHIENFEREAETWVNLGLHPHTVSCYYVRRLGGIPRIFTEFVDGGSLADWIQSGRLYEGGTDRAMERILNFAIQFAWGLHYAHEQGLVHQDVKPGNVLVTTDGTVKVTDFGLAKARALAGETPLSSAAQSILVTSGGMTPAYCSPEQANARPLSRKTDIWSWAISVFEMFAGEPPCRYGGQLASEVFEAYLENGSEDNHLPLVPIPLAILLQRCFYRDPDERPRTLREAAEELERIYKITCGHVFPLQEPKRVELAANGLNNRALSMLDLEKCDEAERWWQKANDIDRSNVDALFNLSLHKLRSKDEYPRYEELRKWIEERFSEIPRSDKAALARSQLLAELGEFRAAFQNLNILKRTRPCEQAIHAAVSTFKDLSTHSEPAIRTHSFVGGPYASVSCDWQHVVTGHCQKNHAAFKVVNLHDSVTLYEIDQKKDGFPLVAFSENRKYLTIGFTERNIADRSADSKTEDTTVFSIWDTCSGHVLGPFEAITHGPRYLVAENNGFRIFFSEGNRIIAATTSFPFKTVEVARTRSPIQTLKLLARGKFLLAQAWTWPGKKNTETYLWEVGSWRSVFISDELVGNPLLTSCGRFLIATREEVIEVVDLSDKMPVRYLAGHAENVGSLAFTPNEAILASSSMDGTVRIWDFDTGVCRKVLDFKSNPSSKPWITQLDFSENGKELLTVTRSGNGLECSYKCEIWQIPDRENAFRASFIVSRPDHATQRAAIEAEHQSLIMAAERHRAMKNYRECVKFLSEARSLSGKHLEDRSIEMWGSLYPVLVKKNFLSAWKVASRAPTKSEKRFCGPIRVVLVDSQYAALVETDAGITATRLPGLEPLVSFEKFGVSLLACQFTTPEKVVSVWEEGDNAPEYESMSGVVTTSTLSKPSNAVHRRIPEKFGTLCVAPSGDFALYSTAGGEIVVFDLNTGVIDIRFDTHYGPLNGHAMSHDGKYLATSAWPSESDADDGVIRLWDWRTGTLLGEVKAWAESISFNSDSSLLAVEDQDSRLFFHLPSLELAHSHRGRELNPILWWSADSRFFSAGSNFDTQLVDYQTGKVLWKHKGRARFSPDCRYVLCKSEQLLESYFLDWSLDSERSSEE